MQLLINFLDTHLYLVVALGAAVCFLVWLVVRQKSSDGERESRRTIWSYLFIWPLLLSKKQGDKTVERGLSKREWVGWLIVAIVIVLAVSLTPSKVRSVDAGVSERYAQSKVPGSN